MNLRLFHIWGHGGVAPERCLCQTFWFGLIWLEAGGVNLSIEPLLEAIEGNEPLQR